MRGKKPANDGPGGEWREPPPPGSLRRRKWPRFVCGPDSELLEKLYVPALCEAVRYDRSCSYFSSSALSAAARGFAGLIRRLASCVAVPKPAPIRLLVNEELAEEDVRALTETGDAAKLEAQLLKRFKTPREALEKSRLEMLAWLVAKGFLEVRVALLRRSGGVFHAKYGIATDEAGDAIVFRGSGNESAHGLAANFEQLEVSTSWEDQEGHAFFSRLFEAQWENKDPHVCSVPLPEALRLKLIKFAPEEPPQAEPSASIPRAKAAMLWEFIREAPYLPNGATTCDATAIVDLWPHQHKVVDEVSSAWPAGRLLCDEVGLGKTIEAIVVLRRLMAGRGVRRVLVLVPAGLVTQWQGELREKGGLLFPRHEGGQLIWPDGRRQRADLATALQQDLLLMSRETARSQNSLPFLLEAEPWDLVLMDEAHAARRREAEEGEFNSANLLLNLLRELQLRRKARGILLLSATPMQMYPWEPWDLLSVLGEGGKWLSEFSWVRDYYAAVSDLEQGVCTERAASRTAEVVLADGRFPPPPGVSCLPEAPADLAKQMIFSVADRRKAFARWLRQGSPLARRMHRNTRETLRHYFRLGRLADEPPVRCVKDIIWDYQDERERRVYASITGYIERRFKELEEEKPGKGFVMTVYRRRAASSPQALERSLMRRKEGLQRAIRGHATALELPDDEQLSSRDLGEGGVGDVPEKVSAALPEDPAVAKLELAAVERLLEDIRSLRGTDSKRDRFWDEIRKLRDDGRSVLVFTEYTDTMEYVRDQLVSAYNKAVGSYCGDGGQRWDGEKWVSMSKAAITAALAAGEVQVLVCTDAASEGLNLQAAGAVLNYDLPWNPSRVEQRIGRADRIGQKHREVLVVNLFLKDSVDEQVYGALRVRCGLFQRFVGPMQPVLSRARKLLLSGRTEGVERELSSAAEEAERDVLAREFYFDSEADPAAGPKPVARREDFTCALGALSSVLPVNARRKGEVWSISGLGGKQVKVSCDLGSLEADASVIPLTPESEVTRNIIARLRQQGELLPLVVGSVSSGSFRASVALWVTEGGASPVETVDDLRRRLDAWSGDIPDAAAVAAALQQAEEQARKLVRRMERQARKLEEAGLTAQLDSARERLTRELGRYLVCLGCGSSDLNAAFHREMQRDLRTSERLRRVYKRLGGYPEWSPELRRELEEFANALTENGRAARLMGSEIDAALQDPRWRAIN